MPKNDSKIVMFYIPGWIRATRNIRNFWIVCSFKKIKIFSFDRKYTSVGAILTPVGTNMITGIYLKGSFSFAPTYISWFRTLHSWQRISSHFSCTLSTTIFKETNNTHVNFCWRFICNNVLALVGISLAKSLRVIQQAFRIIPVKEELSTSFS